MPPKKKKGEGKTKAPKAPKEEDNTPPLHELWTLAALHTQYEEVLRDLSQCRQDKARLENEVLDLKNTHAVTYEKFQQEFEQHKSKIEGLMASAALSDQSREESDRSNKEQMEELSRFASEAHSTLATIKGEWRDKQKLLRDAEGAVVRNAQLEIENSQLNRTVATLKSLLRRRERQLVVVKKASAMGMDEHHPESSASSSSAAGNNADLDSGDSSVSLCPLILEAMKQFPDVVPVQRESLRVLSHLLADSDTCTYLLPLYPLELSLHAMRLHRSSASLQLDGSRVVWRLASSSPALLDFALANGAVPMLLNTLRSYRHAAVRRLVFAVARLLQLLVGAKHRVPSLAYVGDNNNNNNNGINSLASEDVVGGGFLLTQSPSPDIINVRDGEFPRVEASRKRANPPVLPPVALPRAPPMLKKQSTFGLGKATGSMSKRGSLLALAAGGGSSNSIASGSPSKLGGDNDDEAPPPTLLSTINKEGELSINNTAVSEGSTLMTTLLLTLDFLVQCIEEERIAMEEAASRASLLAQQKKAAEELRQQQQFAATALRKGGAGNSSSPNIKGEDGHKHLMNAVAATQVKGKAVTAFTSAMGGKGAAAISDPPAGRKMGLAIMKKGPSSSAGGEGDGNGGGLGRTMSMPHMKSYGAGNNIFGSAEDEGGDEIEEEGGADAERENKEEDDDDDGDLGDGDEVATWDPSKGESLDGIGGKKRRSTRNNGGSSKKLDSTIAAIALSNTWATFPLSSAARDCLISCVMALDADADGGARRAVERPGAQSVVVRAMGTLEGDGEAMTAACMLIRASVRGGGESVKERDRMADKLIEIGLADKVARLLEIHAQDTGKLNTECTAMIEELGTKFDRLLPSNIL